MGFGEEMGREEGGAGGSGCDLIEGWRAFVLSIPGI